MFDKNENDEVSFSDAYRSEILGKGSSESKKSRSLLKTLILLLIVIIVGGAIFAYLYLNDNKQSSGDLPMPPQSSQMLDNIEELEKEINLSEESAEEEKSELNSTENPKEESQETSTQKGEETYLEQLAELSKEIDGEK